MKKLLALVFGSVLALLICELALRVIGYAGDSERLRSVFDPRYGTVARDSWIWDFAIDPARHSAVDLGGDVIPLVKPAGETRVLFLGDSATEGALVGRDRSFPAQFAQKLTAAQHVRVINAGVWGMTTIDEYHLLRDKLLPLRPDQVVVGLFMANDLNFNLGHQERRALSTGTFDRWRSHSALLHFISLKWLALGSRSTRPAPTWAPLPLRVVDRRGLHLLSYPEGELATYLVPPSPEIDHAFEVLERVLADFVQLGRERGFSVRVLLIPSPSRVLSRLSILHYPNLLAELAARGLVIEPAAIDVDAPTRRVLSTCARAGVLCMDPTARLQHLGARAFFPTDEHPTVQGHEALARELAAH
ncbi:MAG TPA: GDSL-type esterase/lipase family protein [Polyangiales bacterium]|nr:GDSL-type esterase/lipase family protein [Polyangiales bacterium]